MTDKVLSSEVPLSLIMHQGPMIRAWGRAFARAWLPFPKRDRNPAIFRPLTAIMTPPAKELIDAYVLWSGGEYEGGLPPHMFSQWGLPLALQVIEQSRYNVVEVINQGVSMRVMGELSRAMPLVVRASLESLQEYEDRADLAVKIVTGNKDCPRLVEAILHTTFLLSESSRRAMVNKSHRPPAGIEWREAGSWRAQPNDGFQFALLTGDFNPIHWVDSVGKKSRFGRTVLQGLGLLARTYETLRHHQSLSEIDITFQRPVPLPSGELRVEYASADESWQILRLRDDGGRVRAAGRFR